jgi:hypothetical protein
MITEEMKSEVSSHSEYSVDIFNWLMEETLNKNLDWDSVYKDRSQIEKYVVSIDNYDIDVDPTTHRILFYKPQEGFISFYYVEQLFIVLVNTIEMNRKDTINIFEIVRSFSKDKDEI